MRHTPICRSGNGLGLTPYPFEPIAPQSDRFDTEEEYAEAVKAYEGKVEAHREKCAELTAKAEAGEITLYITIGRNDVTLGYMATPAKPSEDCNNPKAEIAKLEAKDKRNKEIAVERTIEDTKKKILEAEVLPACASWRKKAGGRQWRCHDTHP